MAADSNDDLRFSVTMGNGRVKAEDLTPEEQAAYLEARAARATPTAMLDILRKAGTTSTVLPGDEIPDGWLDGPLDPIPTPADVTAQGTHTAKRPV